MEYPLFNPALLAKPVLVLLIIILLIYLNSFLFKKINKADIKFSIIKNSIASLIILSGIVVFILSLPIQESLKGNILSFLAIVVSAGIALSSTTVLGNFIAGIMNNAMKRFGNGDLIKIGELQGRVTKRSIFYIEIQLEDSNFMSIPNLYIASNPVKLTRKNDTVISASVSLGYDISRSLIEESLKEAAVSTGLTDPYVYITELGDYSVVYQIHGFLEDSSKYFSTNSLLKTNVMDTLHKKGIEIVSPAFMNQRNVNNKIFIPKDVAPTPPPSTEPPPENLVFDEAIKSEQKEESEEQKDGANDDEKKSP